MNLVILTSHFYKMIWVSKHSFYSNSLTNVPCYENKTRSKVRTGVPFAPLIIVIIMMTKNSFYKND